MGETSTHATAIHRDICFHFGASHTLIPLGDPIVTNPNYSLGSVPCTTRTWSRDGKRFGPKQSFEPKMAKLSLSAPKIPVRSALVNSSDVGLVNIPLVASSLTPRTTRQNAQVGLPGFQYGEGLHEVAIISGVLKDVRDSTDTGS